MGKMPNFAAQITEEYSFWEYYLHPCSETESLTLAATGMAPIKKCKAMGFDA